MASTARQDDRRTFALAAESQELFPKTGADCPTGLQGRKDERDSGHPRIENLMADAPTSPANRVTAASAASGS